MEKRQFELMDQAQAYSTFRPPPPSDLIEIVLDYLVKEVPQPFGTALDVGCGPGQSTQVLSPYFQHVIGCDVSLAQIREAIHNRKSPNIEYILSTSDVFPAADHSVDLLNAANCFHWLDKVSFFSEAHRVLSPGGVLAVYSSRAIYPVTKDANKNYVLSQLTDKFLYEDMKNYRFPCVQELFQHYENTRFPFDDVIRVQNISQTYLATAMDASGYIRSMSTFQNFLRYQPKEAEFLLQQYQSRIMEVLGLKSEPAMTPLMYKRDYFLILCRNSRINKK